MAPRRSTVFGVPFSCSLVAACLALALPFCSYANSYAQDRSVEKSRAEQISLEDSTRYLLGAETNFQSVEAQIFPRTANRKSTVSWTA